VKNEGIKADRLLFKIERKNYCLLFCQETRILVRTWTKSELVAAYGLRTALPMRLVTLIARI
jgi:hypothetical protein